MDARLITDPAASGPWNMAVDETLREWAGTTGGAGVRFYEWSPAALSLGYFQTHASRSEHRGSCGLPAVRRVSGGGAIVHDRELTYSFVLALRDRFALHAQRWVRVFHRALVDVLGEWKIRAELCPPPPRLPPQREPFLCFQRRSLDDVLLDGHKIAGSAQRRHQGSLLQHGSVLLGRSAFAPELPGLCDLAGRPVAPRELLAAWRERLASDLGLRFASVEITAHERARADWWQVHRFASNRWTQKR